MAVGLANGWRDGDGWERDGVVAVQTHRQHEEEDEVADDRGHRHLAARLSAFSTGVSIAMERERQQNDMRKNRKVQMVEATDTF